MLDENETKKISVKPTIIIGIGGSGKEVLMRLRIMMYEKYLTEKLPIQEYLWIDTDVKNQSLTGLEKNTKLFNKIYFDNYDKIDVSISDRRKNELFNNLDSFGNKYSWIHEDLKANLNAFKDGAGQIRPFGRLAFFENLREIEDRLKSKEDKIKLAESKEETKKMGFSDIDDETEVIVISSIAGGTGSGMLIDLGFLLQKLEFRRTAILFLPDVFKDKVGTMKSTIYANAYATLKEIDYYMYNRDITSKNTNNIKLEWDSSRYFYAPVYDNVYLIGAENKIHRLKYEDVFQMVAENLLINFEKTTFATKKRSDMSNKMQHLSENKTYSIEDNESKNKIYSRVFPYRYSSFGLSQIQFNRPRIANAAAYKFAEYIVDFLLTEKEIVKDFEAFDFKKEICAIGLAKSVSEREISAENNLKDILYNTNREHFLDKQNRLFEEYKHKIKELFLLEENERVDFDKQKKEIEKLKKSLYEQLLELKQQINNKLFVQGLSKGEDHKIFQSNLDNKYIQLKKVIEEKMLEWLANPDKYGFEYVKQFLSSTKEFLSKNIELFRQRKKNKPDIEIKVDFEIKTSNSDKEDLKNKRVKAESAWFGRENKLKDIDDKIFQIDRALNNDNIKNIENYLNNLEKNFKSYIELYYEYCALDYLSSIDNNGLFDRLFLDVTHKTDSEEKHVEKGLTIKIDIYKEKLKELKKEFQDYHQDFLNIEKSDRNKVISLDLDYKEEIIKYLKNKYGISQSSNSLQEVIKHSLIRFLNEISSNSENESKNTLVLSINELINKANNLSNQRPWQEIKNKLEKFSLKLFADFKKDESVVAILRNKYYSNQEIMDFIESTVLSANVPLKIRDISYVEHKQSIVGVSDEEFLKEYVRKLSKAYDFAIATSTPHSNDTILFFSEYYAFPIHCLDLYELKKCYQDNDKLEFRHIVKNYLKFTDIVPPDYNEALEMFSCYRSFFLGILLGIIRYDNNIFRLQKSKLNEITLSKYIQKAIDKINYNEDIRINLNKQIQDKFKSLRVEHFYFILSTIQKYLEDYHEIYDEENSKREKSYYYYIFNSIKEYLYAEIKNKFNIKDREKIEEIVFEYKENKDDMDRNTQEIEYDEDGIKIKFLIPKKDVIESDI
ncbi:MAG: hypothetical protein KatS3mg068_1360 [Candidatus Sericytochromatia bacterium]|nr:MAG: hypothetical protein KatS3mg068_1360 [Candidatus Sericytochromatia bacterium]